MVTRILATGRVIDMKTKKEAARNSRNHIQLFLMLALATLLVSTVYYRYQYVVAQDKVDRYEVSYVIKKSRVGEVLDTKNFSFAVTKVEFDTDGIKDFPAAPGMQFVIVSVSIHNKTSASVSFLPIFEAHLKDDTGNNYEVAAAPKINVPSIAGTIDPGVATNGVLGYMIPLSAKNLEFVYEPRAFPNANTILYDIRNEN